jgi:predicted phosphodiesterase
MKYPFGWLLLTLLLGSCDLIEYHPYDCRISGESGINARNIKSIETTTMGRDSFRFAVISDTQRWYDETSDEVNSINARGDIDFVIHCGDLSDFGATKEFEWMRDILNGLKVPYVCVLGNHDCLGTGEDTFTHIFGEKNYTFTAGNVQFICLNTNAMEYDYSEPVPDFTFMESVRDSLPSTVKRSIVVMHVRPYDDQFNDNVAKVFEYYVKQYPGLMFSLCGHGHHFSAEDLFNDGNIYYECPSSSQHTYLVFSVKKDSYSYEKVDF